MVAFVHFIFMHLQADFLFMLESKMFYACTYTTLMGPRIYFLQMSTLAILDLSA